MSEIDWIGLGQTVIIFLLMGMFTVIVHISKQSGKVNWSRRFNLFYINIIAGWGLYSLLAGLYTWFTNFPQKVFTIMLVTYTGYSTLEWMKKNEVLRRILEIFMKEKK